MMPAQSGMASRAPTVAASMGLVNGLQEKQILIKLISQYLSNFDWLN